MIRDPTFLRHQILRGLMALEDDPWKKIFQFFQDVKLSREMKAVKSSQSI